MKIGIISPAARCIFDAWKFMNMMPQSGPLLVKYLNNIGHEAEFIDQTQIEPELENYDVVGISLLTPSAIEGYKLASKARKLNIPTIAGGYHATVCTDEALKYFDVVVRGSGIPAVKTALEMIVKKERGIVNGPTITEEELRLTPERRHPHGQSYQVPNTIVTSHGCPHKCDFCTVSVRYDGKVFFKPRETIERDVDSFISNRPATIIDDNLSYVKDEVLDIFKDRRIKFFSEADVAFVKSERFQRAVDSGLQGLAFGFESIDDNMLKLREKRGGVQSVEEYQETMRICRDNGIAVMGFFLIDPDSQDFESVRRTVDWTIENQLDLAQFFILTPFPGTPFREKVKDRIFTDDWSRYDETQANFRGLKMDPEETNEAIANAYHSFYTYRKVISRSLKSLFTNPRNFPVVLMANYTGKTSANRIWPRN